MPVTLHPIHVFLYKKNINRHIVFSGELNHVANTCGSLRAPTMGHSDMKCCCFGAKKFQRRKGRNHEDISGSLPVKIQLFTYKELKSATNDFHASNKIGRGGFGIVYKGVLRNGVQVAVKALSAQSKQGVREFLTEIDTVSNVKHPNLVELIGCCAEESHRILVYEFVENSSLDRALLGTKNKASELNWGIRSGICMGTAKALAFLHEELEPPIVHRDIKASNILLEKDFVPKIGDFGMAKLFPEDISHISTRVAGTSGYLAPEYARGGKLTKKADVYSFGILILEIISGRSNGEAAWMGTQKLLLELAWQLYEEGRLLELVDPNLTNYPEDEVAKYIKVGLFCTQASASRRPLMTQVFTMLSRDIRLNETELTAPGYFHTTGLSDTPPSSSNKETTPSNLTTEIVVPSAITELIPR